MKSLFLSAILIATANTVLSQDTLHDKNVIMLDAAGPVVAGIGISYERYINPGPKFKPTARTGVGMVNSFQNVSWYLGSSLLWGGRSNVELGFNYLFGYDKWALRELDEGKLQFENGYQVIIGYRYQAKSGFLGRIYWVAPIGCCGSWIPVYSGLALGYAF